jgi:hypothetical protein
MWCPAMEAQLCQLGIFRIVTGKPQEPLPLVLIIHRQDINGQDKPLPQAALILNGRV